MKVFKCYIVNKNLKRIAGEKSVVAKSKADAKSKIFDQDLTFDPGFEAYEVVVSEEGVVKCDD